MAASEMLRARVDKELSRQVKRWAKEHHTDISETIRVALRKLMKEADLQRRFAEIKRDLDEDERMGLFDPPKGPWKAGGFR